MIRFYAGVLNFCTELGRTWFERKPDLLNAFRGVRSRVQPTAKPEPRVRFGVRKILPENRTEPDFGSTIEGFGRVVHETTWAGIRDENWMFKRVGCLLLTGVVLLVLIVVGTYVRLDWWGRGNFLRSAELYNAVISSVCISAFVYQGTICDMKAVEWAVLQGQAGALFGPAGKPAFEPEEGNDTSESDVFFEDVANAHAGVESSSSPSESIAKAPQKRKNLCQPASKPPIFSRY
ncbi:uncharacterized protein EDB91DRAFT_1084397 [Suillus paluster]|uniref:uncharacterized protein n=1 Tax=Suillus paluster TaxID=48578 RepID=UPI001B87B6E0|nr:uncharacterized protein EDB91DRAFT_1084397 [Suillus paluster]KAG1733331.1 hypothetical protein EDB91DRAFT_1084397 [Suillus paluster]